MTEYEIRLDQQGRLGERTSGSTVLVAEGDGTSIHWGNHGVRGTTYPIVTVRIRTLSIYLDEEIIGKPRLQALRGDYSMHAGLHKEVTDHNKYDAAMAAIDAGDIKLAMSIEPRAVYNSIVSDALTYLSTQMSPVILSGIIEATHRAVRNADERAFERGREAAREEIRKSLGLGHVGRVGYSREETP